MIQQVLNQTFGNKSICILGFGREGKSSYRMIRKYLPDNTVYIADADEKMPAAFTAEFGQNSNVIFRYGQSYNLAIKEADIILKSPGISSAILTDVKSGVVTSQTDIFLNLYRRQTIGVTGTKGKSTTVSLLYHIFKTAGHKAVLLGNIGLPPLDFIDEIDDETIVIFEMSSHQLETTLISPSTAILLNIFQEHLDHYNTYLDYQLAKMNIALRQLPGDTFIVNDKNPQIASRLSEKNYPGKIYSLDESNSDGISWMEDDLQIKTSAGIHIIKGVLRHRGLHGYHNLYNIAAACLAAHLKGVSDESMVRAVSDFSGLPHRLELVREWNGRMFYNDSISTIPEATIEALKTFPDVDTLILGGYDRGIDYSVLAEYLFECPVPYIIFIGKAGNRMLHILTHTIGEHPQGYFWFDNFEEAVAKAVEVTRPGRACLLSPAASSYDMFKNFEERGEKFRRIINSL
jgi:UDP-N-acetylmuramoyl-L-alanine---L-glutamate ligase